MTEIRPRGPRVRTRGTAITTYLDLEVAEKRWAREGVTFPTFGCPQFTGRTTEDPCVYGDTPAEPNLEESELCLEFNSFAMDIILRHSTLSGLTHEELKDYVQSFALLHRSSIIARETMTGGLTTDSPSLIGEADTVVGLDSTPEGALAAVEQGLAAKMGNGLGMVHVTPGVLSLLVARGAVEWEDGQYVTPVGHTVVADAGYSGGAPGTGTVTAGESWIYGSGPVFLKTMDMFDEVVESLEMKRNKVWIEVSAMAVVAFEACAVVAAKVDLIA